MYVSIIGLQLWLLVEMIYCYGKISAASIVEAQRESMSVHTPLAHRSSASLICFKGPMTCHQV